MKFFISLALLFAILTSPSLYSIDERLIEGDIERSLQFWQVPGASIVIIKDQKVVLAKGFGYRQQPKLDRVDANTLFPIASLTKSFTAIATGIFAEKNQSNWDSPICSMWPSFKLPDFYASKHLTILDCLSMRAGLTGPLLDDSWWNQTHLSEKALIKALSQCSFPYGFRGGFAYQNLLYSIIGQMIEQKTGKRWEEFVKEQLLQPLKMDATQVTHQAFLASNNKAFPNHWVGKEFQECAFEPLDVINPAAGLSSNATDMVKWVQFLLDKQQVYRSIIQKTLTPQTLFQPEGFFDQDESWMQNIFFPESHLITYGMGWFIHDYKGVLIFQDPGLTAGMNALMALVPELNLGIVILNNLQAPFFSHSILFHVIDAYRGEKKDWDAHFLKILSASSKEIP